jgi:hypothetical protein
MEIPYLVSPGWGTVFYRVKNGDFRKMMSKIDPGNIMGYIWYIGILPNKVVTSSAKLFYDW